MQEKTNKNLELMLEFFNQLHKNQGQNPNSFVGVDENGNNFSISTRMFALMVKLNQNESSIKVVSDEKFKNYDARTFYHGYRKAEHMRNYFSGEDYHIGYGFSGNGFYLSSNLKNAMKYTEKRSVGERIPADKNRILPVKFVSGAKGVSIERLEELCNAFNKMHTTKNSRLDPMNQGVFKKYKVDDEIRVLLYELKRFCALTPNGEMFERFISKDKNLFAMYLGYDYIVKEGQLDTGMDLATRETDDIICTHVVGLNNGAMLTAESEYLKICEENQR